MAREVEKLNDVRLRQWLKRGEPTVAADGGGLTFTLSKAGTAAWILRYRFGGRPRELTLGRYPDVSLRLARERAREARAQIQGGIDVAASRQQEKRQAAQSLTFGALVDDYVVKALPLLSESTRKQRLLHFKNHIKPALGKIATREITPEDVAAMLRTVGKKTTPNVVELVLTATSEAFKHGQRTSVVTANPCTGLSAFAIVGQPMPTKSRLMLKEEELRALLPRLPSIGRVNQLTVLILLSTCVRIGELARAEWEHVNFTKAEWTIPEKNSKTGIGFVVPLVPHVEAWFMELKQFSCGSRFVLPARQGRRRKNHGGETHYEQRALNAMLHKLVTSMNKEKSLIRRFTPHDLRSTARSYLSALGVNVIVAERCLNHNLGGLVGVYDKHDYIDERREALTKWTDLLVNYGAEAGEALGHTQADISPQIAHEQLD